MERTRCHCHGSASTCLRGWRCCGDGIACALRASRSRTGIVIKISSPTCFDSALPYYVQPGAFSSFASSRVTTHTGCIESSGKTITSSSKRLRLSPLQRAHQRPQRWPWAGRTTISPFLSRPLSFTLAPRTTSTRRQARRDTSMRAMASCRPCRRRRAVRARTRCHPAPSIYQTFSRML